MITAKAIRRPLSLPNGAYPTNQECERFPKTSAVPVLPATGGLRPPRMRAAVPRVTTSRMERAMNAVESCERIGTGSAFFGSLSSPIHCPCGMEPPRAMVAATRAILKGVAITWPWP